MSKETLDEVLVGLGKRLARAREAAGLTQEQLVIRVNSRSDVELTRSNIGQYEKGISHPPSAKLDAIAAALGVEVSFLFGRRPMHPLEIALNQDDVTDEERLEALDAAYGYLEARRKRRMPPRE